VSPPHPPTPGAPYPTHAAFPSTPPRRRPGPPHLETKTVEKTLGATARERSRTAGRDP
jgi:hypothetical protein